MRCDLLCTVVVCRAGATGVLVYNMRVVHSSCRVSARASPLLKLC